MKQHPIDKQAERIGVRVLRYGDNTFFIGKPEGNLPHDIGNVRKEAKRQFRITFDPSVEKPLKGNWSIYSTRRQAEQAFLDAIRPQEDDKEEYVEAYVNAGMGIE